MLLQTLTTRLITATMSMQNWNMSEYVTIIHCPPFFLSEGAKRRFPSAKRGRADSPCQGEMSRRDNGGRDAARLPFIGSTIFTIAQDFQKCKKKPPKSGGFRSSLTNSAFYYTIILPLWAGETIRYTVGGSADTSERRCMPMRITLHIGPYTVTIIVKRRGNRHSAK